MVTVNTTDAERFADGSFGRNGHTHHDIFDHHGRAAWRTPDGSDGPQRLYRPAKRLHLLAHLAGQLNYPGGKRRTGRFQRYRSDASSITASTNFLSGQTSARLSSSAQAMANLQGHAGELSPMGKRPHWQEYLSDIQQTVGDRRPAGQQQRRASISRCKSQLQTQQQSVSGVSLDEEMVNVITVPADLPGCGQGRPNGLYADEHGNQYGPIGGENYANYIRACKQMRPCSLSMISRNRSISSRSRSLRA